MQKKYNKFLVVVMHTFTIDMMKQERKKKKKKRGGEEQQ